MLPREFPPDFSRWRDDGTWCGVNYALVMRTRELEGRQASPSAGIIDSQSKRRKRLDSEAMLLDGIAGIGKDMPPPRERTTHRREQQRRPVAVLDVGAMHATRGNCRNGSVDH
jgi:hypothetical protein